MPSSVEPSMKFTVPVGALPLLASVTLSEAPFPAMDGFGEATSVSRCSRLLDPLRKRERGAPAVVGRPAVHSCDRVLAQSQGAHVQGSRPAAHGGCAKRGGTIEEADRPGERRGGHRRCG